MTDRDRLFKRHLKSLHGKFFSQGVSLFCDPDFIYRKSFELTLWLNVELIPVMGSLEFKHHYFRL